MSEERTPDSPQLEPTPAPEPTPTPQPDQQAAPDQPAAPQVAERPVGPDWRDRRIGEQQARIRDLRAQLERFQAATQPRTEGPGQPYAMPPPNQAQIEQEIQNRAVAMAATQEFNRRCNETAEVGRRAYADFDVKVNKLVGLVDGNDPSAVMNYNQFLNAAMETGEASKLIYALGGDLNEASRILSLPPLKMAVELTKMSSQPVQEISGAPRPISPVASMGVNNRSSVGADDPGSDQLSTEEWMRRRSEQVAARRIR